MSRIGKQQIVIPEKVEVNLSADDLAVKGPLGELHRVPHPHVNITQKENSLTVNVTGSSMEDRALWGTFAAHLKNMIDGVTKGYVKKLAIEGVGYKVELSGDKLNFSLGFSHQIPIIVPKGIKVVHEKGVLTIAGIDKEKVGQFAAKLVAMKKPEPYKGKGIRYEGQVVRRKQGKKTVA